MSCPPSPKNVMFAFLKAISPQNSYWAHLDFKVQTHFHLVNEQLTTFNPQNETMYKASNQPHF